MFDCSLCKTPKIPYSSLHFIPSKKAFKKYSFRNAFQRCSLLLLKTYVFTIEGLDRVVTEKVTKQMINDDGTKKFGFV